MHRASITAQSWQDLAYQVRWLACITYSHTILQCMPASHVGGDTNLLTTQHAENNTNIQTCAHLLLKPWQQPERISRGRPL
jgi:hypothetical protein